MTEELISRWPHAMMNNYGTPPVALVRGEGVYVWDVDGKRYIDLLAGIAVNILGHAHPRIVEAVTRQISTLGHTSNLYATEPAIALAERLLELNGRDGRVLFCNSGAEANEAAFKLSRLTGRTKIVAAQGAFHGRTMGALALTGQPAKQDPFRPLPGDVEHVPYGDIEALASTVDDQTAMVILEPIMGEGGVVTPPPGYLLAAQQAAHDKGALFVLDEVQTGICRTGSWFAYQAEGLRPDAITLAKGLGGGMPIGATIAFGAAGELLMPGSHGTTFGGNPVCSAAALAVLDVCQEDDLAGHAKRLGAHLESAVMALADPVITGVRGAGLLRGITLSSAVAKDAETSLRHSGFLANAVAADVLRIAPPLVITDTQLDEFLAALPASLTEGRNP